MSNYESFEISGRSAGVWRQVFANWANFKTYIGNYPPTLLPADDFAKELGLTAPMSTAPIYYMQVDAGGPLNDVFQRATDRKINLRIKNKVIAQNTTSKTIATTESLGWVRGFVRVLGIEGRPDMVEGKRHELFIPYPPAAEFAPMLPIPQRVLAIFQELALERSAEVTAKHRNQTRDNQAVQVPRQRSPYLPFEDATRENASWSMQNNTGIPIPQLKDGDLVYFDVDEGSDGTPVISAVSFSAIWRGGVPGQGKPLASMHDFFDTEMRPYSDTRKTLSPAERLFGFVSTTKKTANGAEPAVTSYMGRVRFSNALLEVGTPNAPSNTDPFEDLQNLKILASPKPPSPSLYFTRTNGMTKAFAKEVLKLEQHRPQGKKVYLHHTPQDENWHPWRTKKPTDNANQKNAVRPLRTGLTFTFQLDFVNLTETEINLLCFSLRPSHQFRHKLGMGRPLGLGTVLIDTVTVETIDRRERYAKDDLFSPKRFHQLEDNLGAEVRASRYAQLAEAQWPEAIYALLLLGESGHSADPDSGSVPVHMPLVAERVKGEQANLEIQDENKTYEWFSRNAEVHRDQHKFYDPPQHLTPIDAGKPIPTMLRLQNKKPPPKK